MSSGDEVSINNAINYAVANGISTVTLSSKTYIIRNPIYIRTGITLAGQGANNTVIKLADDICDDSSSEFYIPSSMKNKYGTMVGLIMPYGGKVNHVTFHDFSMDANRDTQYGVGHGYGYFNTIQLPNSSYVEVYDINFWDSLGDFVRVYGDKTTPCTNVYVYRCSMWASGHDSIFVLRGKEIYIHDCVITAQVNSCIRLQDVYGGYIYNNKLTGHPTIDSGAGLELAAQYWDAIKLEIYNNKIYETWGPSCELVSIRSGNGSSSSESVKFHHNIVYNCGNQHGSIPHTAGFSTEGICNVNVENNVFIGNKGGGVLVAKYYGYGSSYSGMRINVKNNIFVETQLRNKTYNSKLANSGWGVANTIGSSHYVDCGYNCFYNNVSGAMLNVANYTANFEANPQMASWSRSSGIDSQDCHLKSKYGRYSNGSWIKDNVQSPCIDKGDPTFSYSNEPQGNGGIINIGMYGNTNQASLSSGSIEPKKPVADFVASKTSGKAPFLASFTDLSENGPTKWKWTFGDNGVSNVQDPLNLYNDPGVYSVTLTVSNSAGSDTYTRTNYITVKDENDPIDTPEAAFTYTPIAGISPLKVQFTDKSSNNPTSWEWTFGDGASSTSQNPSHSYTTGTYDVKLVATNATGSSSITKFDAIKVTNGTPIASFTGSPNSGNLPLSVQFTDKSYNKPTTWKWNFGDRVISTKQNPEHIYSEAGMYTVTLTATNSYGSNTLSKSKYITVVSGNPYTGDMYDNRIISSKPSNVYTGTSYLDIGADSNGSYRSLLWFNLDDYKGKTLQSAKLCLYWYGSGSRTNDTTIEVYRPSIAWDPANVSWNYRIKDVKWTKAGGDWCDRNGDSQGSSPYDYIVFDKYIDPTEAYYELDVTQLVNEYINDIYQNFGFLLKAKTENGNYIKFYSLENGSNLVVPYLRLIEAEEAIPIDTFITIAGDGTGDFNCDGKDDNIQINQAFKLVKDNPTKYSGVHLKGPFTYNIGASLTILKILEGDSTAVIKLNNNAKWDANVPLIKEYKTGTDGITIKGFTIDGNRDNNTNVVSGKGYYDFICINDCSNISVHDMKFINGHNNGVYTNNCDGVSYYNNDVQLLGYDGFFARNCKSVNAYSNIINCRINNGIHIYNSDYVNVRDNEIYSEGSGTAGIYIEKYGTVQMVNVEVYNNTVYNTMFAGILAIGSSSFNANTGSISIHNNIVYSTGAKSTYKQSGGIIVSGFNSNIENNTVDNCYSCGIGVREVNGTADITGTVSINIRSNIIVYTQRDATNNKGYALDYEILPGHDVRQANNCMYGNTGPNNHNVNPSTGDTANIYVDPLFADITVHNYSLKSIAGRYDPIALKYVSDDVNSPCIDKGYAESENNNEPEPNGGRIDVGAYGNTIYGSLTGDHPIATNHAPVLDELTNKVAEVSKKLTFTIHATDEDNDALSYTMTPVPTGATLNLISGVFEWTPTTDQVGTYAITFTASDGYLTDSATINIGVTRGESVSLISDEIVVNVLREATPTTVYNLLTNFSIGGRLVNSQNTRFRTLILTDLSDYSGKTITSAVLSVFWYYPDGKERGYNTVLEVYRPVAWNKDYACWNNRISGSSWATPGGDWYDKNNTLQGSVPFASETFLASTVPDLVYHNIDVTDLVQAYCNNTYENTGFLLKAQTENSNWIAYYSQRMLSNVQLKLIIQYVN